MRKGERVTQETTTEIHKFGTTWTHIVEVYYIHEHYNIEVRLQETNTGFLENGATYKIDEIGVQTKDQVQETIEQITHDLFDTAASRSEARDLTVSVCIE